MSISLRLLKHVCNTSILVKSIAQYSQIGYDATANGIVSYDNSGKILGGSFEIKKDSLFKKNAI